ncbi:pentatricopeptide repeat-containing protein At5g48910 isoform X3 [Amborella trichopoda]|nr:pentatricopeptide repeat-containing protein At5g48910 isoform X3 [Amborella trichopoda]|eukprot:XP_020522999.1 pentatricopeptide repeat-containing protein At5g48910 isoform X3 [Amborella trichopoda]
MLIYEYIPNGSVSRHLYEQHPQTKLEFKHRLLIALGAARGLDHLHAMNPPMVHKDFKTHNVLVDENFIAKVADFGVSDMLERVNDAGPSQMMGVDTFMDPEVRKLGRLSDKSDVYSFGVFLLELLSGREAVKPQFPNNGPSLVQMAMQIENMRPDEVTMVSVVSACTSLGALELGKWVHHYLSRNGFELTVTLATALMDMYAKCGCLEGLLKIFHKMPQRNLLTWTSLIGGLAINGRSLEALTAYESMKEAGMRPDDITLIGVLSACSHGGLVQEGWSHFHSIKQEFKMEPRIEHYGCMVDLLGRAGQLEKAYQFIESLPIKPNSIMWRTLLGACASHGNLELGRLVSNRILEIELDHEGDYVLLSNIYGGLGRWADKAGVRNLMRERGIEKRPGCSIVEVDGVIHEFVAGDESHPRYKEINEMVANIMKRLKLEGYVPDVSNVLFDIDNEEKEKVLSYHGEKLAMAFSLLSTRNGVPIRIVKNLRICRDCHNVMKLVSEMFDREIIVRDRNRFHHFRNKSCSCGDYW